MRRRNVGPGADVTAESHALVASSQLLQPLLQKPECDWMNEFAVRLPLSIMMDMLGLPPEDFNKIKTWTDNSMALLSGVVDANEFVRLATSTLQFHGYLVDRCRAAVATPPDNLLGTLAQTTGESSDDALNFSELVSAVLQLIVAGSESGTRLTIGGIVRR